MVGSFRQPASANGFCSNICVGANPANPMDWQNSLIRRSEFCCEFCKIRSDVQPLAMEFELPGCQGHSRDKSESRQVGKERTQIWMTHQQPPLHRHDRFHTRAQYVHQQSLANTQQQSSASEGSGGVSIYSSCASVDSAVSSASGQLASMRCTYTVTPVCHNVHVTLCFDSQYVCFITCG